MDNEFHQFTNADPEYIDGVLLKIQRSFNIRFDNEGLKNVRTLRNLCDVIVNKINQEHEDSCSTQHAFYLLRNVIASTTGTDRCSITPHTKLANIFPREHRLQIVEDIENELGFQTSLLQPKQWVIVLFSLTLLASFAGIFYSWPIGAVGVLASVAGLKLAGKFGKEMHLKTVGDMANKISRDVNLKAKRSSSVNKNEVEQKVRELFANELNLQPIVVKRNQHF